MRKISIFILSFYLLFAPYSKAALTLLPDEKNNVEIYQKYNSAVVNITTITLAQDFFFDVYPQKGVGSGAIIRSDGHIITNDHVLGSAHKIMVTMHDKSNFEATIVGRDPDTDIAVIKINPAGKKMNALNWGSPSDLVVGQKVLVIGNPFGLGGTLTVGIISALNREIRATTGRVIKDVIQTDAAINPGNSGGPILNSAGDFIGISSQIFSTSGGSVGVGFAINVGTAHKIADQLIQYGQVVRPWLGIEGVGLSAVLLQGLGLPIDHGIMLVGIARSGPAHQAGLVAASKELVWGFRAIPVGGDVVYQIDNIPVYQMSDIQDYIFEKKVGESVVVHYLRGKKKSTATVRLNYPPQARKNSF